jgi:putative transposase
MTAAGTQGDPHTTIQRLCQLGGVSRAGYYRHFEAHAPARADADLRDVIQRISLNYGDSISMRRLPSRATRAC